MSFEMLVSASPDEVMKKLLQGFLGRMFSGLICLKYI